MLVSVEVDEIVEVEVRVGVDVSETVDVEV